MLTSQHFNIQDAVLVLQNKWKQWLLFVVVCMALTTIVVFILPKEYKSTAIVVAGNPALADKGRHFNKNIQNLYSNFGNTEDLDRIYGIANLDTTLRQIVWEFGYVHYYKINNKDTALATRKAVLQLEDDITIEKTDLQQLKIVVYHQDKYKAAAIANRIVQLVQMHTQNIWKNAANAAYQQLQQSIHALEDSTNAIALFLKNADITAAAALNYENKQHTFLQQLQQYYTEANELQLVAKEYTPALYVLQQAYPSAKHDRPKRMITILIAGLLSSLFGLLATLVYHRKKA